MKTKKLKWLFILFMGALFFSSCSMTLDTDNVTQEIQAEIDSAVADDISRGTVGTYNPINKNDASLGNNHLVFKFRVRNPTSEQVNIHIIRNSDIYTFKLPKSKTSRVSYGEEVVFVCPDGLDMWQNTNLENSFVWYQKEGTADKFRTDDVRIEFYPGHIVTPADYSFSTPGCSLANEKSSIYPYTQVYYGSNYSGPFYAKEFSGDAALPYEDVKYIDWIGKPFDVKDLVMTDSVTPKTVKRKYFLLSTAGNVYAGTSNTSNGRISSTSTPILTDVEALDYQNGYLFVAFKSKFLGVYNTSGQSVGGFINYTTYLPDLTEIIDLDLKPDPSHLSSMTGSSRYNFAVLGIDGAGYKRVFTISTYLGAYPSLEYTKSANYAGSYENSITWSFYLPGSYLNPVDEFYWDATKYHIYGFYSSNVSNYNIFSQWTPTSHVWESNKSSYHHTYSSGSAILKPTSLDYCNGRLYMYDPIKKGLFSMKPKDVGIMYNQSDYVWYSC